MKNNERNGNNKEEQTREKGWGRILEKELIGKNKELTQYERKRSIIKKDNVLTRKN